MATNAGSLLDTVSPGVINRDATISGAHGHFSTFGGYYGFLGNSSQRYFKLQATNANAPNGLVTWVNNDASTYGRPVYAGPYGDTEIIDSWVVDE